MDSHRLDVDYVVSLLRLATDDNPRIRASVHAHLDELGDRLLPHLETVVERFPDLRDIARRWWGRILLPHIADGLKQWHHSKPHDLLEGIWWMTRPAYPDLSLRRIRRHLLRHVIGAWMEAKSYYSLQQQIQSLNYYFFVRERIQSADPADYHPATFFLHRLLDERVGSPLTLSMLYVMVAQRLGIPAYGVNLPYHFVVAVMERPPQHSGILPSETPMPLPPPEEKVAFYVNPYRKGVFFFRHQLDDFLAQIGVESRPEYYRPCPNLDMLIRMARNLEAAYRRGNDDEMARRYRTIRRSVLEKIKTGHPSSKS